MYVDIVPNRSSPPAILLREVTREGSVIRKKTLANLSHLSLDQAHALRALLKGSPLVPADQAYTVSQSTPHGHVAAVLGTLRSLGLERMIASQGSRNRDLVVAMIAEQILHATSKLADTRSWHLTTLAEELHVADAEVNELYEAMDWLVNRQRRIEKKLAKKHFHDGCYVFYDVTSSYYEGTHCSLARWGYNRDRKRGTQSIVYGTLADQEGRPIGVDVYPGNTGDSKTVGDQVNKLQHSFGLNRVVLVGDRGMLTQTQIDELQTYPGIGWISALRSSSIKALVDRGSLQPSLFDQQNLAEIHSPEYPGERLIVCYNPLLAEERKRTRTCLLDCTRAKLEQLSQQLERRKKPITKEEIGVKAGKVVNAYTMAKHIELSIGEKSLEWKLKEDQLAQEQQLDGIYVIRTSEPECTLSKEMAVWQYKNLSQVERIYRTVKGVDVLIRPIRHRAEQRVRAHIFLCMLAYYVIWHMKRSLTALLFEDEDLEAARRTRDPVLRASASSSAKEKKHTCI